MKNIEINELPELFKNKKISLNQARDILWTTIYLKPYEYGLQTLTEDQRSDYLIWLSQRFIQLLNNYKHGTVCFSFFLKACIKKSLNGWIKRQLKKYAGENCLEQHLLLENEEKESPVDFMAQTEKINVEMLNKILNKYSDKQQKIVKDFIHICACKACHELDLDIIKAISDFLGINFTSFLKEINELKTITSKKNQKRQQIIERRNRAFYFHKKFLFELSRLDPSSISYNLILEKYKNQTENWKKINEELKHKFSSSPTSTQIALSTGIKPRQVSFYLNHKKKRSDLLPFINYPLNSPFDESEEK